MSRSDHVRASFADHRIVVERRAPIGWTRSFSLSFLLVSLSRRSSLFILSNLSNVGTSVEVRYTAIDLIGPWTTNTNVSYSIDGITRGEKQRKSTNQTDYLYNQLLFQIDGLPNVEHTLRVDLQMPGVLLVRPFGNRAGGSKGGFLLSLITSFILKRLSTWKQPQTKSDLRKHLAGSTCIC